MPIWRPLFVPGAEVESLNGRFSGRVFEQYSDGQTLVMPEGTSPSDRLRAARLFPSSELLPSVDRAASSALDRRPQDLVPWCRQQRKRTLAEWPVQRVICRTIAAQERAPSPPAQDRPTPAPAKPRPTAWART